MVSFNTFSCLFKAATKSHNFTCRSLDSLQIGASCRQVRVVCRWLSAYHQLNYELIINESNSMLKSLILHIFSTQLVKIITENEILFTCCLSRTGNDPCPSNVAWLFGQDLFVHVPVLMTSMIHLWASQKTAALYNTIIDSSYFLVQWFVRGHIWVMIRSCYLPQLLLVVEKFPQH